MNRIALLCLCGFLAGGAGCVSVDSPVPIGKTPVTLQESDWNGTWLSDGGAMVVRVVDAAKGTIQFAWIENEKGDLVMKKHTVQILQTGDWAFANLKDPDTPGRFLWGLIKNKDGDAILWIPDGGKIKALVKDGTLPGTVVDDKHAVHLGTLSEEQTSRLTSDKKGLLYNWQNPIWFHKWTGK